MGTSPWELMLMVRFMSLFYKTVTPRLSPTLSLSRDETREKEHLDEADIRPQRPVRQTVPTQNDFYLIQPGMMERGEADRVTNDF